MEGQRRRGEKRWGKESRERDRGKEERKKVIERNKRMRKERGKRRGTEMDGWVGRKRSGEREK